jgi:hypothetical protein
LVVQYLYTSSQVLLLCDCLTNFEELFLMQSPELSNDI